MTSSALRRPTTGAAHSTTCWYFGSAEALTVPALLPVIHNLFPVVQHMCVMVYRQVRKELLDCNAKAGYWLQEPTIAVGLKIVLAVAALPPGIVAGNGHDGSCLQ